MMSFHRIVYVIMYMDMFLLNQECPCYVRALIISIQVNKLAVVTQGWFSNEGNC